jgi:acyl carrier protein
LKTSSGKLRRLATTQLLVAGQLDERVLQRGSPTTSAPTKQRPDLAYLAAKHEIRKQQAGGAMREESKPAKLTVPKERPPASTLKPSPPSASSASVSSSSSSSSSSSAEFVVLDPAGSPLSSTSVSVTPTPLQFEEVKTAVAGILGEELQLDAETILLLSRDFQFEEATTLDEYGLDSLTAMKIAGRLTKHFDLLVSAQTRRKHRMHARIRSRLIRLLLFSSTLVCSFHCFRFRFRPSCSVRLSSSCSFAARMPLVLRAAADPSAVCVLLCFSCFAVADPTMDGVVKLIIRLKSDTNMRFTSAADLMKDAAGGSGGGAAAGGCCGGATHGEGSAESSTPLPSSSVFLPSSSSASSAATELSSSVPLILGLGCVVPGPGAPQAAITAVMVADMQLPAKKAALFEKICESAGIDRRYSCLPSIEAIYFGRKGLGNNEGVEARNAIFKEAAPVSSAFAQLASVGPRRMLPMCSLVACWLFMCRTCSGAEPRVGEAGDRALGRTQGRHYACVSHVYCWMKARRSRAAGRRTCSFARFRFRFCLLLRVAVTCTGVSGNYCQQRKTNERCEARFR